MNLFRSGRRESSPPTPPPPPRYHLPPPSLDYSPGPFVLYFYFSLLHYFQDASYLCWLFFILHFFHVPLFRLHSSIFLIMHSSILDSFCVSTRDFQRLLSRIICDLLVLVDFRINNLPYS